eukprot:TRINITY_DN4208_c0_g1_i3.p3 TRINITY_DN4208_c0_g1~~TRINITY_DN4208_c0_g1_i3.p3  ORF type:complete len:124 (-),score=33.12 TRINITY_DN4208_c0_g1_i3:538-909(-)
MVEEEFLKLTREGFQKGFPKTAYVGACALVTVVAENKAYVASAGDCKAAVIRAKEDKYEGIKASRRFSANKKSEQQRLAKQFPNETDIVLCVTLAVTVETQKRLLRQGKPNANPRTWRLQTEV